MNAAVITVVGFFLVIVLAILKFVEFLRDIIFPFDVDIYSIRSGQFHIEKDWALQLGNKGDKKIRFFLLKKLTTTVGIDYDCVEKIGKRNKITIIEKAPKQFTPVKKEVFKIDKNSIEPATPDEIFALLPRHSVAETEALMDSADKIAMKAFLNDDEQDKFNKTLILIIFLFLGGLLVSGFITYKYLAEGLKAAGDYHRANLEAYSRQVCTDQTVKILQEWQKNGTIPEWALNMTNNIQQPKSTPPDVITTTQKILKIGG